MKVTFNKGGWNENDFRYAYSPACFDRVSFRQEDNSIVNAEGKSLFGYEYISILDKTPHKVGVVAEVECSFEKFGAPLIVLSDDIMVNEKGEWIYGKHFEVVAYEEGINVWKIVPDPSRVERPIKTALLASKSFTIADNSRIIIRMEIEDGCIKSTVNGESLDVEIEDLPKGDFWVGITACEGINRFYSLSIED